MFPGWGRWGQGGHTLLGGGGDLYLFWFGKGVGEALIFFFPLYAGQGQVGSTARPGQGIVWKWQPMYLPAICPWNWSPWVSASLWDLALGSAIWVYPYQFFLSAIRFEPGHFPDIQAFFSWGKWENILIEWALISFCCGSQWWEGNKVMLTKPVMLYGYVHYFRQVLRNLLVF